MNYEEKIIDMIKNMKNEDYLMKIYYFVKVLFEKSKRGD